MAQKIKNGLLLLIFIFLFLPMLQQEFTLVPVEKFTGNFDKQLYHEFTWTEWWDGSFWNLRSQLLTEQVGFEGDFVKLNNQLDYSLFHKYKSQSLVIGDNNCLFYREFLFPYYGKNFVGTQAILGKVSKLKALQDTFAHMGKSLVLIQAPCKVSYYADLIPAGFKALKRKTTNYEVLAHVADSIGINHIDLNSWFVSLKPKTTDLLFTKESIHWSMYGSLIAADSCTHYLEQLRHVKMVRPCWTKIEHTRTARYTDDDITKSIKMILPFSDDIYSYPEVTYPDSGITSRPRVIYIGDSFLFNWMKSRYLDNANIHWEFWFYFKEIWDRYSQDDNQPHKSMAGYDWVNAINNADCIVLIYTSANDAHLGDGFIEQAYQHYFPAK